MKIFTINNKKEEKFLRRKTQVFDFFTNSTLQQIQGRPGQSLGTTSSRQKFSKKDDFHCSYIVGDKNHIYQKLLKDKNICFNYLASHLFKAILKGTNDDVQVIIDNRSVKVASKNSLQDYIKLEALTKWGFEKKITFEYQDSQMVKNLQSVHLIANVVYGRYTYNKRNLYDLIDNKFIHRIEFPQNRFNT